MTTTNMFLNFGGKWDSPPLLYTSTTRPIIMNLSGLLPDDTRDLNKRLGLARQTPDSGMLHTKRLYEFAIFPFMAQQVGKGSNP